jgi:hypothetical protein
MDARWRAALEIHPLSAGGAAAQEEEVRTPHWQLLTVRGG